MQAASAPARRRHWATELARHQSAMPGAQAEQKKALESWDKALNLSFLAADVVVSLRALGFGEPEWLCSAHLDHESSTVSPPGSQVNAHDSTPMPRAR